MSTTQRVQEALTIPAVRAWLEAKAPATVAGLARDGLNCPLATFLRETQNVQVIMQTSSLIFGDMERVALPLWAKRFIYTIDTCFSGEVSVADALTTLEDAERYAVEQAEADWAALWPEIQAMAQATPVSLQAEEAEEKVLVTA